jgi:hypothetical protein
MINLSFRNWLGGEKVQIKSDQLRPIDTIERLQPVLMIGPKAIGKSSLINRIADTRHKAGATLTQAERGLYLLPERYWSNESNVLGGVPETYQIRPGLRFWDVPGEFGPQQRALQTVIESASDFFNRTRFMGDKTGLGVVLACFMGTTSSDIQATKSLYTEQFFTVFKEAIFTGLKRIQVESVVIVFNKWDLWLHERLGSGGVYGNASSPEAMIRSLQQDATYSWIINQLKELQGSHTGRLSDPRRVPTCLGRSNESGSMTEKLEGLEDMNVSFVLDSLSYSFRHYLD